MEIHRASCQDVSLAFNNMWTSQVKHNMTLMVWKQSGLPKTGYLTDLRDSSFAGCGIDTTEFEH